MSLCWARWDFREKSLSQMLHMYGLSPEWTRMWTLSWLGVLHSLSHTLHTCLTLLGFVSACFVWVNDTLDFLFVDTTACMLDVSPFGFRTTVENGAVMVHPVISVHSAGKIRASENIKEHQQLFACLNTASFDCTEGPGQSMSLISFNVRKWTVKLINFNFTSSFHTGVI